MPSFRYDGVEIAYLDEGAGDPVMLVHGFASKRRTTGPCGMGSGAQGAGGARRADNRGHGLHQVLPTDDYALAKMGGDLVR